MKKLALVVIIALFAVLPVMAQDEMAKDLGQTSVEVTSTAAVIVAAAPHYGQYVWIQNNDAAGIVYINTDGTATASTTMITLGPGDSINLGRIINPVSAIGSIASNANVAALTW